MFIGSCFILFLVYLKLNDSFFRTEGAWFSFLRPQNWEILIMEALLHVPGNEEKQQTFRISVSDYPSPSACKWMPSTDCGCPQSENLEKK